MFRTIAAMHVSTRHTVDQLGGMLRPGLDDGLGIHQPGGEHGIIAHLPGPVGGDDNGFLGQNGSTGQGKQ